MCQKIRTKIKLAKSTWFLVLNFVLNLVSLFANKVNKVGP